VVVARRARQPLGTGLKPAGQRPAGVHVTPVVDVALRTRRQLRGHTVVRRLLARQFLVVPMRRHWLLGQMTVGRQETPRVAVGAAICRQPGRHVLTPLRARQPPGMDAHPLGHAMRRWGAHTNPWVLLRSLTLLQPAGHVVTAGCLLGAMHPPVVRVQPAGHKMTWLRVHVTPWEAVAGEVLLKPLGQVVTEGLEAMQAPNALLKPVGQLSVCAKALQMTPAEGVAAVTMAKR